ncbi:unnamed protein product [Diatraea saccharalis]|uniref:LITAF domain-containing protein n=1 Tax=Diatraea saccharalis TaxID=40085 RepID=A0A9N9R7L9_9NEOP|nr:unnamed protein product [Diatraea saccharalis]
MTQKLLSTKDIFEFSASVPIDSSPQPQPPPYSGTRDGAPVEQQPVAAMAYVAPANAIMVQAIPLLGSKPTSTVCRSCNKQIVTRTERRTTTKTHLIALAMCAVGLWCCCCLPYYMDSCQSMDHYCPSCHAYLGTNRN